MQESLFDKNSPFRFFGDECLIKPCEYFQTEEFGGEEMNALAKRLVEILSEYRKKTGMGRGLAANQIGVNKRMIVVWLKEEPEIMVNPEIIELSGKGSYWESCISGGSFLIGEVIRPWIGKFHYYDLKGTAQLLDANEKETRVLLHEIDHLNGEICFDKYEPKTVRFITGGKDEVLGYELKKLE